MVFAKAPVAGAVKTRLAPLLGEAGAAALHERLVERALTTATAAGLGDVELWCAPDAAHPFFVRCAGAFGVALTTQGEGDLGERMARAFRRAAPAILIGTDCPVLAPRHLADAARALRAGADVVLAPAEDGGYVLIGLAAAQPRLFEDVTWGSERVLAATRERIDTNRLRAVELETLWDVDRPEDYRRLLREIPDAAPSLPMARASEAERAGEGR